MSVANGPERRPLTDEILRQLPLAEKTALWGTLGTIRPHLSFNVERDVQALLESVSGEAVDYRTIIALLTDRSNDQRQQIAEAFLAFTKQDLKKTLQAAVSGHLEGIIVGLLRPAAQYDADEIKTALKGPETDTLTEILSTRTKQELREILDFYEHDFKSDLEKDIASETTGHVKDLLVAFIKANREKYTGVIDYVLIKQDTKALVDDGRDGGAGQPTGREWIRILTQRSPEHLNRVFSEYRKTTGFPIEEAVGKYFQGDLQKMVLTLVALLQNTPLYFATKLYNAIKGPETSPRSVAHILISRRETDLLSIRTEFKKRYGTSLYSFISKQKDTTRQPCWVSAEQKICKVLPRNMPPCAEVVYLHMPAKPSFPSRISYNTLNRRGQRLTYHMQSLAGPVWLVSSCRPVS
uniref:Annexin A9 isoform X1 n=1 Tax=Pogona vitticeps TaxID=103695 RepID=A0ABM5F4T5_9SAUR